MSLSKVIIFIVLSGGLAYFSRTSLIAPRSHGFYRFLAWECILALLLVVFQNFSRWFGDPFSIRQLVSWFLLSVSLVPVIWGVYLLRRAGKPQADSRQDPALIGIEKTTRLVTRGIYRYIRHPLYSSLLLLSWGFFFKGPSWLAGALALGATLFLVATARAEEVENIEYFGPEYPSYMERTKMFIPFLF